MARQYVKAVGEYSLTGDSVVRVRFHSPGFFVVTHPDLDFTGRYEQRGERELRCIMRPGVLGVFLADGEVVGYMASFGKEAG